VSVITILILWNWFKKLRINDKEIEEDFAIVHGNKMFLPSNRGGRFGKKDPAITGIFDPIETSFVKNELKKDQIVLDIGAGVGYYTLLFADIVGENGKVFAFEPEPKNYNLLKKNVKLNNYKNIILKNLAVSNVTGKTKLYISDYPFMHSILPSSSSKNSIKIPSIKLDDFFKDKDIRKKISFIKVDTEGYDLQVLHGGNKLLEENNYLKLIIEFNPSPVEKAGSSSLDLLNFLKIKGFSINYVNHEKERIEPVDNFAELEKKYQSPRNFTNLICTK